MTESTKYYFIDMLDDCKIYKSFMTPTDKYIIEFKENGYITSILFEFVNGDLHIINVYRKNRNYKNIRYLSKYYNMARIVSVMLVFK